MTPGSAPPASTPRLRVVLDTNVVVSALLFKAGRLAWLRRAWQVEQLLPLVNRQTVDELVRVLAYPKFKLSRPEQEELLSQYLPACELVLSGPALAEPAEPRLRDPDDGKFLVLARQASADYLVTGDADLLTLAGLQPVAIIRPEELRKLLAD